MTLTVELAPQAEAWLSAEAQRLQVSPADVARRILEERAADSAAPVDPRERVRDPISLGQTENHMPVLPPPPMRAREVPTQELFRKWEEEDVLSPSGTQDIDPVNQPAIKMLQAWLSEEASDDPEVIRQADEEVEELK